VSVSSTGVSAARDLEAVRLGFTRLRWFEVFAALRSGAIMVSAARLLSSLGIDDSWLTRGNPTVDLLAELIAD
jgi:hypothetical protein